MQIKLANNALSPCVRYCSRTDLDMPNWSMAKLSQRLSRSWKKTITSATTHFARKWIDGLLLIPHRLAESAKSIENNTSFHVPRRTWFKICRDAESDAASMTILQMAIRVCLTDSEMRPDDRVCSINCISVADVLLSFGLMKVPTGSTTLLESQKPGCEKALEIEILIQRLESPQQRAPIDRRSQSLSCFFRRPDHSLQ
jgi:hypothetical protein